MLTAAFSAADGMQCAPVTSGLRDTGSPYVKCLTGACFLGQHLQSAVCAGSQGCMRLKHAIHKGWICTKAGTFVKFTQAGAELFA